MVDIGDLQVAAEVARRKGDGVSMFRPLETQIPFFRSMASELALIGGNRSGKSACSFVKLAATARGLPVITSDGEEIPQRLPWQEGRPLLIWTIGHGWDHIGDTIWRILFKPGLYKIIRDEQTRQWRAFNPYTDADREHQCRGSFPLIPMSEVDGGMEGIGWENRKERQFSMVPLKNGTVIRAFASTGEVKMGDPVDYIGIDETINSDRHYPEWQARLSDTKGRIVWSMLSDMNSMALLRLNKRADDQARELAQGVREKADVEKFVLRFSANPFIDDEEKRKRVEGWDEDERKMRDEGEFLIGNLKIYPTFSRDIHCAIYENPDQDDELAKVLRKRKGEPPADWTRELILDPGTAKPGVLFCAIPPREFWVGNTPYFVVYDEIYKRRIDAKEIAKRVKAKTGIYTYQRFIIDGQAAQQKPMGFSGTVGQNYSKKFRAKGLVCQESQSAFTPGDPNFQNRSMIVEEWLGIMPCGRPQLRIVVKRCPNLVEQMESNVKAIQNGPGGEPQILDMPAKGQLDDLRDCLEYWASRAPRYVEPVGTSEAIGGPGLREFEAIQKKYSKHDPDEGRAHFGPFENIGSAA